MERGLEQGMERGLERGQQQARRSIILCMLENGLEADEIARLTGVSQDEIAAVKEHK